MDVPVLTFVVAVAENNVIGNRGDLPWRMSSDLKRFRQLTLGRPVIMGRRTFESIGRPLDQRTNIVVTATRVQLADGVVQVAELAEAVAYARKVAVRDGVGEVMVIGGAQIYRALLPQAARIWLTRVHASPQGDTHFPELAPDVWREVSREPLPQGCRDDHAATLLCLEKVKK